MRRRDATAESPAAVPPYVGDDAGRAAESPAAVPPYVETIVGRNPRSGFRRAAPRGFTLLEVLIALLLMSLALAGLMRLSTLEARAAAQLRDSTVAQWVAANAIADVRLREGVPAIGPREGETAMAGRQWRWRMDVSGTEEASINRLDVRVFAPDSARGDDEATLALLTGFAVR